MIRRLNFHETKMERLRWWGVGRRPDAGSHRRMMWACERSGTPALAGVSIYLITDLPRYFEASVQQVRLRARRSLIC